VAAAQLHREAGAQLGDEVGAGGDLVVALDLEGILVSSGAACSSGKPEPSHVLISMGQSEERVRSTIRVSFRSDLSRQDVPRVVTALQRASERMRNKQSGASSVI
jgi:cysteine desulfurase